jgi:hypothetical protein
MYSVNVAAVALVLYLVGLSSCGGRTQLEGPAPVADGGTEAGTAVPDQSMSACVSMKGLNRDRSCSDSCASEGKTCRDDCQTDHGPVAVTYYTEEAACQANASYEYGHRCDQAFGAVNRGRAVTYARCCCR